MDHTLSEFVQCAVGVLKWSNLGPLFFHFSYFPNFLIFLIFFNDLPATLDNGVDSYADDTNIFATAKTVEEIGQKLTEDCEKVSNWMRSNKLKLNPGKTHVMTLGTSQRLRLLEQPVQVRMDGIYWKKVWKKEKFYWVVKCKQTLNGKNKFWFFQEN